MKKISTFFIGWLLLACASQAAVPSDLRSANYVVYISSTLNPADNTCRDLLVKQGSRGLTVIAVDEDLVFSPTQSSPLIPYPSFVLSATLVAGRCTYALSEPSPSFVNNSRWVKTNYPVAVGDVRGDSNGSLLIGPVHNQLPQLPAEPIGPANSSTAGGYQSFSVARTGASGAYQFSLLQTLSSTDFAYGVPGAIASLEYLDADQRTDLVVRVNGAEIARYTAAENGTFAINVSQVSYAKSRVVWNQFKAALLSGNANQALALISTDTSSIYRPILVNPTADLAAFANSITQFEFVKADETMVRAVILIPRNGVNYMYFVVFGEDSDGAWKIYSM